MPKRRNNKRTRTKNQKQKQLQHKPDLLQRLPADLFHEIASYLTFLDLSYLDRCSRMTTKGVIRAPCSDLIINDQQRESTFFNSQFLSWATSRKIRPLFLYVSLDYAKEFVSLDWSLLQGLGIRVRENPDDCIFTNLFFPKLKSLKLDMNRNVSYNPSPRVVIMFQTLRDLTIAGCVSQLQDVQAPESLKQLFLCAGSTLPQFSSGHLDLLILMECTTAKFAFSVGKNPSLTINKYQYFPDEYLDPLESSCVTIQTAILYKEAYIPLDFPLAHVAGKPYIQRLAVMERSTGNKFGVTVHRKADGQCYFYGSMNTALVECQWKDLKVDLDRLTTLILQPSDELDELPTEWRDIPCVEFASCSSHSVLQLIKVFRWSKAAIMHCQECYASRSEFVAMLLGQE